MPSEPIFPVETAHTTRTCSHKRGSSALSCVAMNVYMLAGLRFTNTSVPTTAERQVQCIYMDDRTWTSDRPQLLLQTKDGWNNFSTLMGLQENPTKIQLAASTPQKQQQLRRLLADRPALQTKVAHTAVVLGCSTAKSRSLHEKEKQRLTAAKTVYARQKLLPVKHKTKLQD